ncbi:MAG: TrkH family potassium uptake protein, partial [Thaumarchaeota archaeon]|nr:TrkH family potassium uptake protein [Nitrososphaerota archaeon]
LHPVGKVVSSYFESISAITTTGLTLFDPSSLPRTIIFYRSITQWLGGIGIVFFIVLFLNAPGTYARALEAFAGFARLSPTSRGTFIRIMRIYLLYTGLFVTLLITLGFVNPFAAVNLALTGISTGGFVHTSDWTNDLNISSISILTILMIIGATSFPVHESLWTKKRLGVFSSEFRWFVAYLAITSVILVAFAMGSSITDPGTLIFHAVSAASTTGFQTVNLGAFDAMTRLILLILMFVGGCSFSTAGGIKFIRMIVALRSIPWLLKMNVLPITALVPLKIGKSVIYESEIAFAFATIFAGSLSILLSTAALMASGASFLNSIFESISAFSTVGLTTGVTSMAMPDFAKMALIAEMVIGRVEVIPVLIGVKSLYEYLERTKAASKLQEVSRISSFRR